MKASVFEGVNRFLYIGKPRKFPDFHEEPHGIHLGKGVWALWFKRD